jgi:hypothetical protein
MKIRLSLPLCAVLLLAATLGFLYSCRVKTEAFKGEQMKETQKPSSSSKLHQTQKPATSAPTKPATPIPTKPSSSTKLAGSNSPIGKPVTINTNTITIPGQGTFPILSSTCDMHGACTYTLPNRESITVYKGVVAGVSVEEGPLGPSGKPIPGPEPEPSGTSSVIKASPAPFAPPINAITCPNGEQSTTGCCANGEPQGKYPCCANGTPSRNGRCD